MSKFKVYHAKEMESSLEPEFTLANYYEVATVECEGLDDAYRLTNHSDKDWTLNKGILSCNATCRSTSVGDVIVEEERGKAYRCMRFGWDEVDYSTVLKLEAQL